MYESMRAGLQVSSLGLPAMGTLKLMKINCRSKRPHKVCRLTQCNCHALSTEAPETDLALEPTPAPVNSASSLHSLTSPSLSLVMEFSGFSPHTSHEVGRDRPDVFGQSRGEICDGVSVAKYFTGEICAKQAR